MEIWSLGALPGSFESSGSCPSHEKGRIRFGKTAAGFVVGKDFRSSWHSIVALFRSMTPRRAGGLSSWGSNTITEEHKSERVRSDL
jgi:hypothetical protein